MSAPRKFLSFAQQIAIDRHYNEYDMGGCWDPFDRTVPTDCSDCVGKELAAATAGTAMSWARQVSTESWRPPSMGGAADPNNGPYGTVMVDSPADFPPDAAVLIALHHGDGSAADSHMWCQVDQLKIETHGSDDTYPNGATVLYDGVNFHDTVLDVHTVDSPTTYGANNWWYLAGPIVEDGTPIPTQPSPTGGSVTTPTEAADTLFADVSEFQSPVDNSYWAATYMDQDAGPFTFQVLSIRSNDGDHVDLNFAANYKNCAAACDSGKAAFFIVYYFWRPGSDAVNNHIGLVNALGGPHPRMVSMIDLESGSGNPDSDVSTQVDADYSALAAWLGDDRRVIGYANLGDERTMWQTKPANVPMILAGYGTDPTDPNVFKIAHQYTDGQGYGGGLPEGAPPFGTCDMNSADGFSPTQLADALGVGTTPPAPPAPAPTANAPAIPKPADEATQDSELWDQELLRWEFLGGRTVAETMGAIAAALKIPGCTDPLGGNS